jgi:DNA-binding transcriptional ArsR family regulator
MVARVKTESGRRYDRRQTPTLRMWTDMIDRLREQIQQRHDQLVGEADRLRKALAALDPRSSSAPAPKTPSPAAAARKRTQATAAGSKAPATKRAPARQTTRPPSAPKAASPTAPARTRVQASAPGPKAPATKRAPARQTTQPLPAPSPERAAPGATKAAVLTALAGGTEMTAGQVAEKSGLPRATVSTTLSRLAKSGEVQKAQRGYRLAPTGEPTATPPAPGATGATGE